MPVTLLSIQVGRPQMYACGDVADGRSKSWSTAFFKSPVRGPVPITADGVAGDDQADRVHHGGIDKAVLVYSADHFTAWVAELGLPTIPPGGFGENLTITGLDESQVCIGDRWQFGAVVLEVSQPRQPCWKLNRRWGRSDLVRRVVDTSRSGWYCRVVAAAGLSAPAAGELISRPRPEWTIRRANYVFYDRASDPATTNDLASLPELAAAWRDELDVWLQSQSPG